MPFPLSQIAQRIVASLRRRRSARANLARLQEVERAYWIGYERGWLDAKLTTDDLPTPHSRRP